MSTSNTQNPALIIIDVQQGFNLPEWGQRNNPEAETNISLLLAHWRQNQYPVIHIQHASNEPNSPLRPDQAGFQFKDCAKPLAQEPVFTKSVNSAFIGTRLEEYLYQHDIHHLVIVGLTTDHCVSTSTRMAGNLGFHVILVADATATFSKQDRHGNTFGADLLHQAHLASLDKEFCQVQDTATLLASQPLKTPS